MHVLNHKEANLSVRGPLNIARPIQGWPVDRAKRAPRIPAASLPPRPPKRVFTAQSDLNAGRQFYADVKGPAWKSSAARATA